LRSGALAGDVLGVAGSVGLAAAGLAALRGGVVVPAPALRAFRRPVARIAEGLAAAASAHAAIDVSDGLALDASRIASESGVGVELDVDALLRHAGPDLLAAALALGKDPLELVLHGGEDYALLAALTPGTTPATFAAIGCFVDEAGVFLRKSDGTREALAARGFDHFGQ
ncbi:MAG TPA: AIR synthase-related protein, partial [Polyangiaceae bacterium]|nr:AIR synthase-related protein [Polyangiaceae bacterium]